MRFQKATLLNIITIGLFIWMIVSLSIIFISENNLIWNSKNALLSLTLLVILVSTRFAYSRWKVLSIVLATLLILLASSTYIITSNILLLGSYILCGIFIQIGLALSSLTADHKNISGIILFSSIILGALFILPITGNALKWGTITLGSLFSLLTIYGLMKTKN